MAKPKFDTQYIAVSVSELMKDLHDGKLILPSMQRNYVWAPAKIADLFDSLCSGYPIGTLLFWRVEPKDMDGMVFNRFVQTFDENSDIQRGKALSPEEIEKRPDYLAVLDGQQRITSLNIAINGSMRLRKKKRAKTFVDKYLCVNIWHDPETDVKEGSSNRYHFDFVSESEFGVGFDGTLNKEKLLTSDPEGQEDPFYDFEDPFWVPVRYVADEEFDRDELIEEVEEPVGTIARAHRKAAMANLDNLKEALSAKTLAYYPANTPDLEKVVEIFVRINSGGQKLSAPDLMLAMASGESVDAQRKIEEAVQEVHSAPISSKQSFSADKELILKAALMFTGAESLALSKRENYRKEVVDKIFAEDAWDGIVEDLCRGVRLLEKLGFELAHMSKNLLLPVAYFMRQRKKTDSFIDSEKPADVIDKLLIRQWVIRAMVKKSFRDGIGATLVFIRNVINDSKGEFPLDRFLTRNPAGDLRITEEAIDDILDYKYSDTATKPLLAILCRIDDASSYEVDHMWPRTILTSKKEKRSICPGASDIELENWKSCLNRIGNLQLLYSGDNGSKGGLRFDSWVEKTYPNDEREKEYRRNSFIPEGEDISLRNICTLVEKREELMRERIKEEFPDDVVEKTCARFAKNA